MQDVFFSLLKSPPFNEEKGSLKAWIIRITINKCKDYVRYRKRNKTVPLDTVSYSLSSEPLKEEHIDLIDAFNKLSDKDRYLIYMFYFEDYSAKELAEILAKSEAVIFKRINRARDKLKKLLNTC